MRTSKIPNGKYPLQFTFNATPRPSVLQKLMKLAALSECQNIKTAIRMPIKRQYKMSGSLVSPSNAQFKILRTASDVALPIPLGENK